MLYEMLAGQPLFDGDSAVSVPPGHLAELPAPLSHFRPDINPALKPVMAALAKDPAERWQSADEFAGRPRDRSRSARRRQRAGHRRLHAGPAAGAGRGGDRAHGWRRPAATARGEGAQRRWPMFTIGLMTLASPRCCSTWRVRPAGGGQGRGAARPASSSYRSACAREGRLQGRETPQQRRPRHGRRPGPGRRHAGGRELDRGAGGVERSGGRPRAVRREAAAGPGRARAEQGRAEGEHRRGELRHGPRRLRDPHGAEGGHARDAQHA